MKSKGLRVNMPKTTVMVSGPGWDVLVKSGKYPCTVCLKGVGNVSAIQCSSCEKWVHGRCSGIKQGQLVSDPSYVCRSCRGVARPIDGRLVTNVTVDPLMVDLLPMSLWTRQNSKRCLLSDTWVTCFGREVAVTGLLRPDANPPGIS